MNVEPFNEETDFAQLDLRTGKTGIKRIRYALYINQCGVVNIKNFKHLFADNNKDRLREFVGRCYIHKMNNYLINENYEFTKEHSIGLDTWRFI